MPSIDKKLLRFLVEKIEEHFGESTKLRLILYGSRARGDAAPRADYDLAVEITPRLAKNWSAFYVDVVEDAPTLKAIDLVNLARCPRDLRDSIQKEGVIVYEQ